MKKRYVGWTKIKLMIYCRVSAFLYADIRDCIHYSTWATSYSSKLCLDCPKLKKAPDEWEFYAVC